MTPTLTDDIKFFNKMSIYYEFSMDVKLVEIVVLYKVGMKIKKTKKK